MKIGSRLAAAGLVALMAVALVPQPSDAQTRERARRVGDVRSGAEDEQRQRTLSRLMLSRSRNVADLEVAGREVLLHCGKLETSGRDHSSLESLAPGEVQVLTEAAATKLRTEADLDFGGTTVPAGNVVEGHPGLYSLWLKRVEGGWHLVFNRESDVWGTQRDPAHDVQEIAIDYETTDDKVEEMTPAILEAENGGVLELRWGRHRWSAPFVLVGP